MFKTTKWSRSKLGKHVRRWNIWRKDGLNGLVYKFLVLIGFIKSPSMGFILLPEEWTEIRKSFSNSAYEEVTNEIYKKVMRNYK